MALAIRTRRAGYAIFTSWRGGSVSYTHLAVYKRQFRAYAQGHPVRTGVVWSGRFILVEALVGAAPVLLEYTAFNVSVGRAIWMAAHLVTTFLLLGALALTVWWAKGGERLQLRNQGAKGLAYWLLVAGMMVLGMSGAITALGDLTAGPIVL